MGIPFTLPMGILLTIALAIQLTISKGTDVGLENAPWARGGGLWVGKGEVEFFAVAATDLGGIGWGTIQAIETGWWQQTTSRYSPW